MTKRFSYLVLIMSAGLFILAMCSPQAGLRSASAATDSRSPCERQVTNPARCAVMKVYGHRGKHGPNENTIWALRYDHRHNVGFETDTWRLRGPNGPMTGVSVIFHDGPLRRTVSAESIAAAGLTPETDIFDVTWAQFKILRTKGGEPIPTLHQWIRKAGEWHVPGFIEIKHNELDPDQAAGWVKQYHAPVSFYGIPNCDPDGTIDWVGNRLLDLGMRVGIKYESPDCRPTPQQMGDDGYTSITHYAFSDPAKVRQLHAAGLKVGGFTTPDHWVAVMEAKTDFIIYGDPVATKRWLRG